MSSSVLKEVTNSEYFKIRNYLIFICWLPPLPLSILQWKFFKENLFGGWKPPLGLQLVTMPGRRQGKDFPFLLFLSSLVTLSSLSLSLK